LIALIANARRSAARPEREKGLATPPPSQRLANSTRQSTGPRPSCEGVGRRWTFEKTSFASNAPGGMSGQAPIPRLVAR